jgi:hypothetical protein
LTEILRELLRQEKEAKAAAAAKEVPLIEHGPAAGAAPGPLVPGGVRLTPWDREAPPDSSVPPGPDAPADGNG